jgi:hypothetical protein
MVEDEPMKSVSVNNVTFEPMDIKALITQIYDTANVGTIFTGQRCNLQDPPKDIYGRFVNEECRDISPGFFHLTITNYIGRFGKSFVVDVSADYEVWNHPVVKYEILQQKKISPEDVMSLYFPDANATAYPFNRDAKSLLFVETEMYYVTESDENNSGLKDKYTRTKYYFYILELDLQENIIGGEWVAASHYLHPDFIYVPVGAVSPDTSILGGVKYLEVKKMIELTQ